MFCKSGCLCNVPKDKNRNAARMSGPRGRGEVGVGAEAGLGMDTVFTLRNTLELLPSDLDL